MLQALDAHMPEWATWEPPGGGFFIWLILAEGVSATSIRTLAKSRMADFFPGKLCYVNQRTDHHFRLCFAMLDEAMLEEAAAILGECLREMNV